MPGALLVRKKLATRLSMTARSAALIPVVNFPSTNRRMSLTVK
jgi:hypothetical protein